MGPLVKHKDPHKKEHGIVYLVGFGPGDPELLTLKADKILRLADIIFYDRLVGKPALKNYKAEKACVGKRKGSSKEYQDEINEMLYEEASKGKMVIRLKGGDPMIFGRGGEELEYLKQRSVEVRVIPGITAAMAAAARIGFPLTQRRISSSAAFCIGHPEESIIVPEAGTLVYYMGGSNLQKIISKIIAKGWPKNTPVALIRNISLRSEKIKITTLGKELKTPSKFPAPLTIIVGKTIDTLNKP